MRSLMESPVASSDASLNQAFAINPEDLQSDSEHKRSQESQESP